ncbi:MAG: tetratricopeptide repeat protein [Bacteroidia bacterium]|nr:tetratricopeptide repeat protein [Bacteroidia bacterium]
MKQLIIFLIIPLLTFGQTQFDEVQQLLNNNEFKKAEALSLQLVVQYPDNLEAIEFLGDSYGRLKKWDEAIDTYKKLVEEKPNNANFHYKYGGALGMKALSVSKFRAVSIVKNAKSEFLKAAELDPKHIETRWALVELYMKLPAIIGGSKRKALHFAEELHNLSEVDGFLAKGFIYQYDKEFELSEHNYLKAIEVGGSETCYQNLIDMYVSFNKHDKALTYLEKAHKKHQSTSFKNQLDKLKSAN